MKFFRKTLRFLTIFLALQVLFSHTGLAVNIHTCQMSGKTTMSLSYKASCCSKSEDSEMISWLQKAGCCTSDTDLKKVDSETIATFDKVQLDAVHFSPICFLEFSIFNLNPVEVENNPSPQYDSPVRQYGRSLLVSNQEFLI